MGATNISGKFVSSSPYMRLITECYRDQVNNNFYYYSGSIGTINTFRELNEIRDKSNIGFGLRKFIEDNKNIKTKEGAIEGYLYENLKYCDYGESYYIVDRSTLAGYEVITYGGYKEVPLSTVNVEDVERYLDKSRKGYTVFKLTHERDGLSVRLKPELNNTNTLKEIEDNVKEDILSFQKIFFAVKNDRTRVYMFAPNIKLQKTRIESNNTRRCEEAYPVYYCGMAWC